MYFVSVEKMKFQIKMSKKKRRKEREKGIM